MRERHLLLCRGDGKIVILWVDDWNHLLDGFAKPHNNMTHINTEGEISALSSDVHGIFDID